MTDPAPLDAERLLALGERVLGHAQTVRRLSRLLALQVHETRRRSAALRTQSATARSDRTTNQQGIVAFEALRSTNLALAVTNKMLEDASSALADTNEELRTLGLEVYVLSEQLKVSEQQVRALSAEDGSPRPKPSDLDISLAAEPD